MEATMSTTLWEESNGNHKLKGDGLIYKWGQSFTREHSNKFIKDHNLDEYLIEHAQDLFNLGDQLFNLTDHDLSQIYRGFNIDERNLALDLYRESVNLYIQAANIGNFDAAIYAPRIQEFINDLEARFIPEHFESFSNSIVATVEPAELLGNNLAPGGIDTAIPPTEA